MDLLKTLLLYMSMLFVTSVQSAPEATPTPSVAAVVTPTPFVVTATPLPTPSPTPVPTPKLTPNPAYKTLRVGDRGEDVKTLQRKLAEYGYYAGEVDGAYGNQTRRSVENFQYNQGLQADGIAGKATLTVLYESDEVVIAPEETASTPASATPVPNTPSPVPSQTPMPTFVPAVTPAATARQPIVQTAQPSATPKAVTGQGEAWPMEGYRIRLDGATEPIHAVGSTADNPVYLPLLQTEDGMVFVPVIELLDAGGVIVVPSTTDAAVEYGVALGNDIFRLSYTTDDKGNVTNLALDKNGKAAALSPAVAKLYNDMLYVPMQMTQEQLGLTYALDEGKRLYTLTIPGV